MNGMRSARSWWANIHLLFAKGKFYFQQFFTLLWTLQSSKKRTKARRLVYSFNSGGGGMSEMLSTWRGGNELPLTHGCFLLLLYFLMLLSRVEMPWKWWWWWRRWWKVRVFDELLEMFQVFKIFWPAESEKKGMEIIKWQQKQRAISSFHRSAKAMVKRKFGLM